MIRTALGVLLLVVAVGAIPSGWLLVAEPTGAALGLSTDLLEGSPFADFFVPGLVLLGLHGVGGLVAGVAALRGWQATGAAGVIFGGALVVWIAVQVAVIGLTSWMQPLFGGIGVAELVLGALLWSRG